jgi:hypothetical protein
MVKENYIPPEDLLPYLKLPLDKGLQILFPGVSGEILSVLIHARLGGLDMALENRDHRYDSMKDRRPSHGCTRNYIEDFEKDL